MTIRDDASVTTLSSGLDGSLRKIREPVRGSTQSDESYRRLLEGRVEQARRLQASWHGQVQDTIAYREQERLKELHNRREAHARAAEETRKALKRAQEETEAIRQVAIEAREQERRRLEEEAEAQRRAEIAAREEAERIQCEEEERRRREKQRECSVCLDSFDMDLMLQVPCSHWYCPEHLRGKIMIIGFHIQSNEIHQLRWMPPWHPGNHFNAAINKSR
jgi:hypothetical protein